MQASQRALLAKTLKVLKKHSKSVPARPDRPVMEQLLFATLLENTHFETAEQTFSDVQQAFFDWNEVRVSTVRELSEVARLLPDPAAAALRIRKILQSIFESVYAFTLDNAVKGTLGAAVKQLEKIDGTTPFSVAFLVQTNLGGHAIPLDSATCEALAFLRAISQEDAARASVSGLERAIPKSKGWEAACLLHQLGADWRSNPADPALHKLLLEISPDVKDRLIKKKPKRPTQPVEKPKLRTATAPHVNAGEKKKKNAPAQAPEHAQKKPGPSPAPLPAPKKTTPAEAPEHAPKKPALAPASAPAQKKPALAPPPAPAQKKPALAPPPAPAQKKPGSVEAPEHVQKKPVPPQKRSAPAQAPAPAQKKSAVDSSRRSDKDQTAAAKSITKKKPR